PPGILQRVMSAAFDYFSEFENDNFVTITDGTQSMSDDEAGATSPPEILINDFLRRRIQGAGCFVEYQESWRIDQGTRNLKSLPLATGKIGATFGDVTVHATLARGNDLRDRGIFASLRYMRIGYSGVPHGKVVANRA